MGKLWFTFAVLAVLVLAAGALVACSGGSDEPTPTTEAVGPTLEPTLTPTEEPVADAWWERIQDAGKQVVGTSVDYPPFEYYGDQSQVEGFDIALMDEIGRRLGVQVEYRDIAFDGLASAVQVGQIDAAIAAISVTPERQAIVDFSNVYFVGEDGILARADSNASIGTPGDLPAYKLGV